MGLENQELFTAKDAEDAKETKQNQPQNQRPFTTRDTGSTHSKEPGSLRAPSTEEGKTEPLIDGRMGQVADEQEQVKKQADALAVKLARTYEELTRLLERNPAMKREITQGTSKEDKVYQKLKQRLKMADMAPRCRWVRQDGTSCGSPQMKQHIYCFAHMQMAEARTLLLLLPPPEDANAIQVGLMRIQKAMIEDTISTKKAGLLLYSMQLALTNVGQTTFGKAKDEEMVRDTVDEEEAISEEAHSNQHSASSQNQTFETHRNGGSGGGEGLPRMGADERGLKPIVWKPTPDMYRMDTPEGREAYEASFGTKIDGTKIKPGSSGEQRSTQAVIPREERSEPYNSSFRDERLPKGPRSVSEPLDPDTGLGSVLQTELYAVLG
jgi:hypothetical protein